MPNTPLGPAQHLNILRYGEAAFVINRTNGRWAVISADDADTLDSDSSEKGATARRGLVVEALERRSLWAGAYEPPGHLNTIILKLTKVCNFGCKYCYDMEPDDKLVHMPFEVAIAAIEEGLQLAAKQSGSRVNSDLGVILHGGEPTLFVPFIDRLATEAHALAARMGKKLKFTGQTNLSRVTPELVEVSAKHKISWGLSLDGPPEINDQYRTLRNGNGTYKLFKQALDEYPDFVRGMGVLSTVTALNDSHLYQVAAHIRDLGFPSWDWSLFQSIGQARDHSESMAYDAGRVIRSWDELLEGVLRGEFDGFEVKPVLDYLVNLMTGPGPDMCSRQHCGAGRDLVTVAADGSLLACDCIDRKGPYGQIGLLQIQRRDSIERALNGPTAGAIRSRDVSQGGCGSCAWLSLCGGTCFAHARELHGKDEKLCAINMHAYSRLSECLATSNGLKAYWDTLYGPAARSSRALRLRRAVKVAPETPEQLS